MANEATVLSLTTTEMATGTQSLAGGSDVDAASANAGAVTASIDIGLYFLKSKYESGDGKSRLLEHLDKIRDKIVRSDWPAV